MGHDISGYAKREVAYLRRSAFNEQAREIYKALGAESFDGGVSGNGTGREFSREELEAALAKLPKDDEDYAQEMKFLRDCLETGEEYIYIFFG